MPTLRHVMVSAAILAAPLLVTRQVAATEICGNEKDDSSPANGMVDEGCNPAAVTGVCESPITCGATGYVSPLTGNVMYYDHPDISIKAAYGPDIVLQRVYESLYSPTYDGVHPYDGLHHTFRAPLGYRFQHNYMSWVKESLGPPNPAVAPPSAILHSRSGLEVLLTRLSGSAGTTPDQHWAVYRAQIGYHFSFIYRSLNQLQAQWEIRGLDGTSLLYEAAASTAPDTLLLT